MSFWTGFIPHTRCSIIWYTSYNYALFQNNVLWWFATCSLSSFRSVNPPLHASQLTTPCTFNWCRRKLSTLLMTRRFGHWEHAYSSLRCTELTWRRRFFPCENVFSHAQHTRPRWLFSYWWNSSNTAKLNCLKQLLLEQTYFPSCLNL